MKRTIKATFELVKAFATGWIVAAGFFATASNLIDLFDRKADKKNRLYAFLLRYYPTRFTNMMWKNSHPEDFKN